MRMPNSACWNITQMCNDNCLFCYRDQTSQDLGVKDRKRVIDRIALSGIKKLTFAGGEPLLIPEIRALIEYAKNKGLIVSLTTNAILLDGEVCDFCFNNLDWLTLSLDGATEEIQSKMTRNSNHFKRVHEVLENALQYENRRSKIKINTVVSRINVDSLFEIADLIKKYPVDRWKLFQFVPLRGNAKEFSEKFEITDEAFEQACGEVERYLSNKGPLLSISGRESIERAYFVIFPNADVKISHNLHDKVIGNVLVDDLMHIWDNKLFKKELHERRTRFVMEHSHD